MAALPSLYSLSDAHVGTGLLHRLPLSQSTSARFLLTCLFPWATHEGVAFVSAVMEGKSYV